MKAPLIRITRLANDTKFYLFILTLLILLNILLLDTILQR